MLSVDWRALGNAVNWVLLATLAMVLVAWWRRSRVEMEPFHEFLLSIAATIVVYEFLGKVNDETRNKIAIACVVGMLILIIQRFSSLDRAVKSTLKTDLRDTLVRTNALIPYGRRLAVTAQVIEFPPPTEYSLPSSAAEEVETLDVIRQYEYQNYFLTPAYLNFLFARLKQARKSTKVVVVDEASHAALIFLIICARIGYQTRVLSARRFNEFVSMRCITAPQRAMVKGNPSLARITKQNVVSYSGRYTNRKKARLGGLGENISCGTEPDWLLLDGLSKVSKDISVMVHNNELNDVDDLRAVLAESELDGMPDIANGHELELSAILRRFLRALGDRLSSG